MQIKLLELPEEIENAFQDWYGDGQQNMIDSDAIEKFKISVFPHIGKIAGKENRKYQENYFNNVTLVWQSAKRLNLSMDIMDIIWMTALEPIINWEKNNTLRIHKGSPYFYLGTSYVENRNVEKGFIYIHEAYQEDIKSHDEDNPERIGELPNSPAFKSITLDPSENNYFQFWVLQIMDFIENKYFPNFNKKYSSKLNFTDFRSKFLALPSLYDDAYLFSYSISRVYDFHINKVIYEKSNYLSTQVVSQVFFDILRIIEGLILNINGQTNDLFSDHIYYLRLKLMNNFNYSSKQKFLKFESYRKKNSNKAFSELLYNQYKYGDGSSPNEIDKDIMFTLGIRNYLAHNTKPIEILCKKKEEIFERLFNVLFLIVSYLY